MICCGYLIASKMLFLTTFSKYSQIRAPLSEKFISFSRRIYGGFNSSPLRSLKDFISFLDCLQTSSTIDDSTFLLHPLLPFSPILSPCILYCEINAYARHVRLLKCAAGLLLQTRGAVKRIRSPTSGSFFRRTFLCLFQTRL